MAGFDNDVIYGINADYSNALAGKGASTTGQLLTNGQLWIGSTSLNAGGTHVNVGLLTSPSGSVAIGYSTPNITLDVAGAGFVWNDVSGAFAAVKENGYFVTGTATATLPVAPVQGDTIEFFVDHATQLLTIQASAGQTIRMGSIASSVAGTWTSTLQGDSCELVFRAANNTWQCVDLIGTWVKT